MKPLAFRHAMSGKILPSDYRGAERPNRPIGITRTLPYNAYSDVPALKTAYKKLMKSLRALNTDDEAHLYVGCSQRPTQEVLYIYIVASGRIVGRCNIAEWLTDMPPMMRLDQTVHVHKYWCVLSAPFVEPPTKLIWRGHQGIRYVYEDLW